MIASVIAALRASGLRNDGHAVGHRLDAGQGDGARRERPQQHQQAQRPVPSASSWASSDRSSSGIGPRSWTKIR